ncbi:hypothetical protein 65p384 [Aeromonas phage 65]|uniref:Uncharacterized protein n=2 Tax=Ishigurovirus osborne TaxID=260149 RepID=A0A219YCT1_9CAUD|nr:hypothetical protein ST65p384 [Aeromonas phage 65]ADQ53391.1 hypothetical protein 65p384 [Aeromonas phage 65]APU01750.1 hypothetical protein [Aeromonas phage 65.2]
MIRNVTVLVETAKALGFRPANGTDTGARGFTLIDGFGRVRFFSLKLMCGFISTIISDSEHMGIVKNPYLKYSYCRDETGGMCVTFDSIGCFYFNYNMVKAAKKISTNLRYFNAIHMQYVKNKNSKRGSYIKPSGGYFWNDPSSSSFVKVERK